MCEGAFIVQPIPSGNRPIEMIRLLLRHVHGVEAKLQPQRHRNGAAEVYAKYYNLLRLAAPTTTWAESKRFCGIDSEIEITTPRT